VHIAHPDHHRGMRIDRGRALAMEMRYVMIDKIFPILFVSLTVQHKDMKVHGNITSAARMKVVNGKVVTFDRSYSLDMGPHPDDAEIIAVYFGLKS
jgi:hypothetical protein